MHITTTKKHQTSALTIYLLSMFCLNVRSRWEADKERKKKKKKNSVWQKCSSTMLRLTLTHTNQSINQNQSLSLSCRVHACIVCCNRTNKEYINKSRLRIFTSFIALSCWWHKSVIQIRLVHTRCTRMYSMYYYYFPDSWRWKMDHGQPNWINQSDQRRQKHRLVWTTDERKGIWYSPAESPIPISIIVQY